MANVYEVFSALSGSWYVFKNINDHGCKTIRTLTDSFSL